MKKRQNAELRRPDILKNYYQVILKEGVEGASIAKVAKRMKIHPSLIIHYFGNKDNMTVGLVDNISRIYNRLFIQLNTDTLPPKKRLERFIDIFCGTEWYNNTDISGSFSILSLSFRNRKVLERIQELYDEFIKLTVRELDALKAAGMIKVKDPKRAAELMISFIEGYRHFKHFYIDEESAESYRQDIISTLKALIQAK